MNKFLFYFTVCNSILIPTSLISTPFLIDQIANVYDTSSWSEEYQMASKENLERGTMMLYIVPPLGANLMLALYYSIFHRNLSPQNNNSTKSSSDPYSEYTDEWREFQMKKDVIDKKNKEDSATILKKYESMPDLLSQRNATKEMLT